MLVLMKFYKDPKVIYLSLQRIKEIFQLVFYRPTFSLPQNFLIGYSFIVEAH